MTTNATTNNGSDYIDLHTTGLGYVSRVEFRIPDGGRKKDAYLRATINAMHGEKGVEDGIQYARFDVRAIANQAFDVLEQIKDQANNPDFQVMVRFKIGDLIPQCFVQTKGKNAGKTMATINGRLLCLSHVWVKNRQTGESQLVYELPKKPAPVADGS